MTGETKKWVVILMGPPGSGKDTQAELLAREVNLDHLKSSKIIENKFLTADPDDPIIRAEKEKKTSGGLVTPSLVQQWVIEEIRRSFDEDRGIIFSGSPRTVSEAEAELPVLEELYGRDNIYILSISLSLEESIKRNSHRRVCQANNHPIPNFPEYENLKNCPEDGSPIIIRSDDTAEKAKHRYKVYLAETKPVIDFLSKKGYNIVEVNGEQPIEDIHREILNKLW